MAVCSSSHLYDLDFRMIRHMHTPRMKLVSVAATEAYMNFNNQIQIRYLNHSIRY